MAKPKPRKRKPKGKPKFSLDRGLVSVAMSIVSLTLLGAALITESLLFLVVSALSALATAAQIRWATQRAKEDARKAATRRPSRPRATTKPTVPAAESEPAAPPTGGVVLCTETGKPVEGEQKCDCASRHITSSEGVDYFGRPIGTPLGRRKKQQKSPMTSSVHRA